MHSPRGSLFFHVCVGWCCKNCSKGLDNPSFSCVDVVERLPRATLLKPWTPPPWPQIKTCPALQYAMGLFLLLQVLYRHGKLHMYRTGTHLPSGPTRSMFVVTSGIVQVTYTDPQGLQQSYHLATGDHRLGFGLPLTTMPSEQKQPLYSRQCLESGSMLAF